MQQQNGFSLVEVLVTLLIFKIGLLGVLSAQALVLRHLQDAIQRTQIVAAAHDLMAELQANPHLAVAIGPQLTLQSEIPLAPSCGPATPCTTEQIALAQLSSWFERWRATVGSAEPELCLQQLGASLQLSVSWLQRVADGVQGGALCQAGGDRAGFVVQAGG